MIGDIIRELRNDKNIDQKELAKVLNVSVSTISNYENEEYEPNIDTLNKLSDHFNVSIDYLFGKIKFHFKYSIMNEYLVGNYSVSNLLNDILCLQQSDIKLVIE